MLVYYAMGGGLGHLTRAVAFLHTLSLTRDAVIVTSSTSADDPRVVGAIRTIRPPVQLESDARAFGAWIADTLVNERANRFVVDSFPAGVLGELSGLTLRDEIETWHVARLLRWASYRKRLGDGALPAFDVVWETEPLHPEQERSLAAATTEIRHVELRDPSPEVETPPIDGPYWLVVHSGPHDEVEDLLRYALELREQERRLVTIVVVSPVSLVQTRATVRQIDHYPAWPMFDSAERIITAAGFNVMRQTLPHRDRHWFVPFPRPLDDQFLRAVRARERSAPRQETLP